jgi:hypothetical protein
VGRRGAPDLPVVLPGRRRRPLPGRGQGPSTAWDPRTCGAERISRPPPPLESSLSDQLVVRSS